MLFLLCMGYRHVHRNIFNKSSLCCWCRTVIHNISPLRRNSAFVLGVTNDKRIDREWAFYGNFPLFHTCHGLCTVPNSNSPATAQGKALCAVFSSEKLKFPGKPLEFNSSKRQQIAFAFNIFPCPQCSRTDAIRISNNTGRFDPRRTPPGQPARAMC